MIRPGGLCFLAVRVLLLQCYPLKVSLLTAKDLNSSLYRVSIIRAI